MRVAPAQTPAAQPGPSVSGAPSSETARPPGVAEIAIVLYSPGGAVMRSAPVSTLAVDACAAGGASANSSNEVGTSLRIPRFIGKWSIDHATGGSIDQMFVYSYASAWSTSSFAARRAGQIAAATPARAARISRIARVPIG